MGDAQPFPERVVILVLVVITALVVGAIAIEWATGLPARTAIAGWWR
jgi:hypothetical protein